MTSNEILKSLKEAPPDNNPQSRDDFYYSVTVGDGESVDVDIHQLKGNLGKILREMEQKLKAT